VTNFNVITLVEVFVCWVCECGLVLEPRIFYISPLKHEKVLPAVDVQKQIFFVLLCYQG
jgi:hypothetical protein